MRVVDKTGLTGKFDFKFSHQFNPAVWTPTETAAISGTQAMIEALEKQLGLKLAAAKVPVDAIIVDNISRTPTAN